MPKTAAELNAAQSANNKTVAGPSEVPDFLTPKSSPLKRTAAKRAEAPGKSKSRTARQTAATKAPTKSSAKARTTRDSTSSTKQATSQKKSDTEARRTKAVKFADGKIKEINVRFEKAAQANEKADDHRLAAAIRLAEIEVQFKDAKLPFKDWSLKNITQPWNTVRQTLRIGRADNPAQVLADVREGNKVANKNARDRKAAAEGKALPAPTQTELAQLKDLFKALAPSKKMDFLNWAGDMIGVGIDVPVTTAGREAA